mmetsp:Transcript_38458/g.115304  ORF Transcript_38458/g.115304 Transcript_38458/m.115304 type:complete len:398 (-) Transcript_38458:385-1578(-)
MRASPLYKTDIPETERHTFPASTNSTRVQKQSLFSGSATAATTITTARASRRDQQSVDRDGRGRRKWHRHHRGIDLPEAPSRKYQPSPVRSGELQQNEGRVRRRPDRQTAPEGGEHFLVPPVGGRIIVIVVDVDLLLFEAVLDAIRHDAPEEGEGRGGTGETFSQYRRYRGQGVRRYDGEDGEPQQSRRAQAVLSGEARPCIVGVVIGGASRAQAPQRSGDAARESAHSVQQGTGEICRLCSGAEAAPPPRPERQNGSRTVRQGGARSEPSGTDQIVPEREESRERSGGHEPCAGGGHAEVQSSKRRRRCGGGGDFANPVRGTRIGGIYHRRAERRPSRGQRKRERLRDRQGVVTERAIGEARIGMMRKDDGRDGDPRDGGGDAGEGVRVRGRRMRR